MNRKLLSMLIAVVCSVSATAQITDENKKMLPFVSIQGGATRTILQEGVERKWAPMGAISIGTYFIPAFGLRLQASGWAWNQNNNIIGMKTKNKYAGGMVDLMFNLCNLVDPSYEKPFNVVLIGGAGLHYAQTKYEALNDNNLPLMNTNKRVTPNLRGGLQLDVKLANNVAFLVEGGYQMISEEGSYQLFSKEHGARGIKGKAWPYLSAGLAYKFGKRKAKPAPTAANYLMETADNQSAHAASAIPVVEEKEQTPAPKPTPLTPAIETKKTQKVTQNISFALAKSSITPENKKIITQVAEWAKENKGTIALTGYADKGTGNATINQKISEQRVQAVKAELIRQGVSASRITTDAKGDTVQPFAQNDQNRVVIAICEEK
ncbi:MAG: OmpA family protein [Prevotella sp.]|nr:OmpA family protein [Prevotella sp.]